jgi:single-strand DNA-binding protein
MSKSVNKVILLGNLGNDAQVKALEVGSTLANFSLATTEHYKDKRGEWQDKTEWHNLVAYGRTAEIIRDYTEKDRRCTSKAS